MDVLYKSGFAFHRRLSETVIELENKFSGLRLYFDEASGKTAPAPN